MKRYLPQLLCLTFFLLTSCRAQRQPLLLELPATPMLTSESLWGVANRPYLIILESSDLNATPKEVLRYGDIVRIISKVAADHSYWFEVQVPESGETGWTLDENIDTYDSSAQARTAQVGIQINR